MKYYINSALLYAIFALVGGIFYREFTKFHSFTGKTTLSVIHTHYFILGMVFFLLLLVVEKNFAFTSKQTNIVLILYHTGLNLTAAMLIIRGIVQVRSAPVSSAINASISGMAGIGHIILGGSLIILLIQIRQSVAAVLH